VAHNSAAGGPAVAAGVGATLAATHAAPVPGAAPIAAQAVAASTGTPDGDEMAVTVDRVPAAAGADVDARVFDHDVINIDSSWGTSTSTSTQPWALSASLHTAGEGEGAGWAGPAAEGGASQPGHGLAEQTRAATQGLAAPADLGGANATPQLEAGAEAGSPGGTAGSPKRKEPEPPLCELLFDS